MFPNKENVTARVAMIQKGPYRSGFSLMNSSDTGLGSRHVLILLFTSNYVTSKYGFIMAMRKKLLIGASGCLGVEVTTRAESVLRLI